MLNLGKKTMPFGAVRGRGKKPIDLSLRLTSLMDMFTILLVFLLKSFSAEGQLVTVTQDLNLPESTSTKRPTAAPIISITKEWIMLDDKPLARVEDVQMNKELLIPELDNALKFARQVSDGLGKQGESLGFRGMVDIMGDRDTPFLIIKKVMYTCGKNAYNNMQLAVYGQPS